MHQKLSLNLWEVFGDSKDGIFHVAKKLKVNPLALARRLRYFEIITPEMYEKIYHISIENFEKSRLRKAI